MTSEPIKVVEVFFSYAHKDERLRDELEKHLKTLKRQGYITTWHDRMISPGKEWDNEINKYLDKAHIILLLISADFLASDYCDSVEVKQALQRHEKGECRVIPIILRPVSWRGAAFKSLRALPKNNRPVTDWQNKDKAFVDIAEGIREVVEEIFEHSLAETPETAPELENQQASVNNSTIIFEVPQEKITATPDNLETENNKRETATLTVEKVISAWENIRKRIRQKYKSGMLSAYLAYYKIIEIEGSTEYPVVVIEAQKLAHFKYVSDENRYKELEWSLEMEFGLPCQVRLVSPPPILVPQSQAIINIEQEDASEEVNKARLTVQEVIASWENIRNRTKQKSKSGLLSAYLGYFKVIDIEGTEELSVVVIQAEKSSHYKYVKDEERYKDLEWALKMEFGTPCSVRIEPPEAIAQKQTIESIEKQISSEDDYKTTLTVQEVIASWESIRKRTKQKNRSGMLSAYLGYYKVIDIEGLAWEPVIVIQAEKLAHYKYVRDEERYKDLEWALEMEFGLPCKVRLVQPEKASAID